MNWDAVKPIALLALTTTLKFLGGALVAHGLISSGPGLEAFTGAGMTAGGAFWSWWIQDGHLVAGNFLKKLTDTATQAAAIEVAKRMPLAAVTGAAAPAKAEAKAIEPAIMAKDAAKACIILVLLAAGAFAFPGDARAQSKLAGPIGTALNALATLVQTDGSASVTLSTQIPELQDFVGQACWSQIALIGKVVKAHPIPLTFKVATDIEALRLVGMALNKVCSNPNCGQMWLDAQNVAAAINPGVIPISLPSICAKIPVLGTLAASALPAQAAPVITPAPTVIESAPSK